MSKISINQNQVDNIDLLIAQRFFYSRAKKIRGIRIVTSILIALISPIALFYFKSYLVIIGAIGGIWALVAYIIKNLLENSNIEKGAKIQENFDTSVFEISWNAVLAGEKVPYEDINYAKTKFKGNIDKLKDWYSDVSDFPSPLDILLCQRSNLVWDWRLKRIYAIAIFSFVIFYFIATIIFCSIIDLKLSEYILGLFLPALSGYFLGIDESIMHFKASTKRNKLEQKINGLADNVSKNGLAILNNTELRQIQDCIFEFRKGPMVPDWFYWFFRDSYENNMIKTLENFRRKQTE